MSNPLQNSEHADKKTFLTSSVKEKYFDNKFSNPIGKSAPAL